MVRIGRLAEVHIVETGRTELSLVRNHDGGTTPDQRLAMVLDVVAGRRLEEVAGEHAILPRTLERWVDQFLAAGSRALAAREIADESTADHLLAIVAHEIRSPLTSAAIALRLLAADRLDAERRSEVIDTVGHQLDLLGKLADDVLAGASVALGRLRLALEPVDLCDLMASCVRDLDNPRVTMLPSQRRTVIGDPDRLRQLFDNVLRNALRHGVDGVEVAVEPQHGNVVIAVTNHAREPVSAEEAGTWFEPFAQVSSRSGHGLGLYVVRALTVAHAGTVGVDSLGCHRCETGQDLRVWVRLPVSGPPTSEGAASARALMPRPLERRRRQ